MAQVLCQKVSLSTFNNRHLGEGGQEKEDRHTLLDPQTWSPASLSRILPQCEFLPVEAGARLPGWFNCSEQFLNIPSLLLFSQNTNLEGRDRLLLQLIF